MKVESWFLKEEKAGLEIPYLVLMRILRGLLDGKEFQSLKSI